MNSFIHLKSKVAVFLLFVFVGSAAGGDKVFSVADDMDASPYVFADAEGRADGIFYEIIRDACKRMNIPLQYEVYPWKRAQLLVQTKQADALITVPTADRLHYLAASREPVFVMKYKIFTRRDNPNIDRIKAIESLSDLKGLKIVDYIGDGWAEKNLQNYDVQWSPNLTSACKMIAANRGDIFLQDEVMVLYAIENIIKNEGLAKDSFDRVVSFDAPVSLVNFHLLIRKDSPYRKLLAEFDETIKSMRERGELEAIKNKWIQ